MFEKLKDASRLLIIPSLALYMCGFVCITGYLSRFGIVTFDVVNARFLIAGVHALLAFGIAVWLGWHLHNYMTTNSILYSRQKVWARLGFCARLLFLTYLVSTVLSTFYSVGRVSVASPAPLRFLPPFGSWDVVGKVIALAYGSSDIQLILQYACYLSLYVASAVLTIMLVRRCVHFLKHRVRKGEPALIPSVPADGDKSSSRVSRASTIFNSPSPWVVAVLDVSWICLLITIFFFAVIKLSSEAIDPHRVGADVPVDFFLVFFWMYTAVFGTIVALFLATDNKGQLTFQGMRSLADPSRVQDIFQVVIIPILTAMIAFGATIFPRIPFAFGGGQPREVQLVSEGLDTRTAPGRFYLIGESSQFLFVVHVSRQRTESYQVNKDSVEFVQSVVGNPPTLAAPKPN